MKAIAHTLIRAANRGKLDDKIVLAATLKTVARNYHATGERGRRYEESYHQFYERPTIANFVAQNFNGPNLNTIYHWRKQKSLRLFSLPCQDNMQQFVAFCKSLNEKNTT